MKKRMGWEKTIRRIAFAAAALTGVIAGHLFYAERIASGAAYLAMTALFLWFASRQRPEVQERQERGLIDDEDLIEMALIVSDLAVESLRGIGRTVPPSTKEIKQLEDRLNVLLDHMGAPASRRAHLRDAFEKLRGRTRRNEAGLALIRGSRL